MKILKFATGRLRNEEWFRFHTEVRDLILLYVAELLGLLRLFTPYQAMFEEADSLLELLRKNFSTNDTTTADRAREGVYRSLKDTAKSFHNSLDATKKQASERLYLVINKYSDTILRGTLSARTAAIDNLVQDLTIATGSVNLPQEVQLLGLGAWVTDLETANTNYKQAWEERNAEDFERPEAGRLKQLRVDMDRSYTNMTNTIDALLSVVEVAPPAEEEGDGGDDGPVEGREALPTDPDERVAHFAKALNLRIAHYKTLLKGRQTRSGKKDEEESEDTEDTEDTE
jgi:hypothetical protein